MYTAGVVKLANTLALGASAARLGGSSPLPGTKANIVMFKKYCKDCSLPAAYHIQTWLDELTNTLLPRLAFLKRLNPFCDILLEKTLGSIGLVKMRGDFLLSEIQMRSACFIDEARKRGIKFKAGKGPFGYTNHFCAEIADKKIRFESLPVAEYISKYDVSFVDCKERTKNHLNKGNFPVAEGKSFWFWQKGRAIKYGVNGLGFPVAFLGVLDKTGQLAHMGVVAHETAETQMRRVGLNQADHCIELVRVAEAAPVRVSMPTICSASPRERVID